MSRREDSVKIEWWLWNNKQCDVIFSRPIWESSVCEFLSDTAEIAHLFTFLIKQNDSMYYIYFPNKLIRWIVFNTIDQNLYFIIYFFIYLF